MNNNNSNNKDLKGVFNIGSAGKLVKVVFVNRNAETRCYLLMVTILAAWRHIHIHFIVDELQDFNIDTDWTVQLD